MGRNVEYLTGEEIAMHRFGIALSLLLLTNAGSFAHVITCIGAWWVQAGNGLKDQALPKPGGMPVDMPGLHNVIHVSDKLYSGGVPEGDSGFESLKKLGVKTILSVDGARPDVVRAKKWNMRYVHLPIGYDGVSQEQAMKLAKAARDLPTTVYIHCHHGKHRSPGAAAVIQICLDEKCTVAQAVDIMKRAGTDPRYAGLFSAPRDLNRPTPAELDRLKADFPESAQIPALAQSMVRIDQHWKHLTLIKKAGWKVPKSHPDLDPPHEALQLLEHYREMAGSPSVQTRPADFRAWLADAEKVSSELEGALRKLAKDKGAKSEAVEKNFQRSQMICSQCHAKYRDVPQGNQ